MCAYISVDENGNETYIFSHLHTLFRYDCMHTSSVVKCLFSLFVMYCTIRRGCSRSECVGHSTLWLCRVCTVKIELIQAICTLLCIGCTSLCTSSSRIDIPGSSNSIFELFPAWWRFTDSIDILQRAKFVVTTPPRSRHKTLIILFNFNVATNESRVRRRRCLIAHCVLALRCYLSLDDVDNS